MTAKERKDQGPKPVRSGEQASDDTVIPHAPDNRGSTVVDPDVERMGGMSGGLGEEVPMEDRTYLDDTELLRQLRLLERAIEQLEAALVEERVEDGLFAEIDTIVENGLGADERSRPLVDLIDDLRASTEVARAEMFHEAVRDCEQVKSAIEDLISDLS